jgi:AhpD family alkylhydroperoxidase
MSDRIDFNAVAPELAKPMFAAHSALMNSSLDNHLIHLVFLRVSQLNGCAYCIDLHAYDLRKAGESERRINALVAWREMPFFSAAERAALAWTESVTKIDETHAPDEVYLPLFEHFDEKQVAALTFAIALMNLFNRTGVGFRKPLPNRDTTAWPFERAAS